MLYLYLKFQILISMHIFLHMKLRKTQLSDEYREQKSEVRKMNICALLVLVYLVGSTGIVIMKKLQPEDKIYPVWVAAICVILTCFVVWYVS